jgi:ABC-2 type transport system permease protein
MNKIITIIKREYITRARKKSFLIMTLLSPIFFALMMIVPFWFSESSEERSKFIYLLDKTDSITRDFPKNGFFSFIRIGGNPEDYKELLIKDENSALLYIPETALERPEKITLYANEGLSRVEKKIIESLLDQEILKIRLEKQGIDIQTIEKATSSLSIKIIGLSPGHGNNSNDTAVLVGLFSSVLIFFFIFLYGSQVMRGVMEEKTSRIIEIIISSVKPFQLMAGKIIGIFLLSLTQFLLWLIISVSISVFFQSRYEKALKLYSDEQIEETLKQTTDVKQALEINKFVSAIESIDFAYIILVFFLYFCGGYLLYGSLFAAIGAAADGETDTQQFIAPVSVPLFFSFIVSTLVLEDPSGNLAYWLSIIPFTSPVIMMLRVPFGVPLSELLMSLLLLYTGFLLTTFLAARIYRVGILSHGKKISYREIYKWLFYKN